MRNQPWGRGWSLDLSVRNGQHALAPFGELTLRKALGPIAIMSLIAGVVAGGYSALLGFGPGDRCDELPEQFGVRSPELDGVAYAGAQVVLVIVAGVGGVLMWRATTGFRRSLLITAVGVAYGVLVVEAVDIYTDAAWDWANSRG